MKEFTISQATNSWTEALSIKGWTYGETANAPSAGAKFGSVAYVYSDSKDGTYTQTMPTTAGTWYVRAVVEETDNYAGLESEAVSFVIEPKDSTELTVPDIDENTDPNNLVIKDGDKTLIEGVDYEVTTKQDGDTVTVTITFKGDYTGTVTRTYKVTASDSKNGTTSGKTDKNNTNGSDTSPATGDTTNTGVWGSLLALSGGLLALLTGRKRRKPKK